MFVYGFQRVYNPVVAIRLHTRMRGRCQRHRRLHERAMKGYVITQEGEITSSVGVSSLGQTLWGRKHMARPWGLKRIPRIGWVRDEGMPSRGVSENTDTEGRHSISSVCDRQRGGMHGQSKTCQSQRGVLGPRCRALQNVSLSEQGLSCFRPAPFLAKLIK